MDEYIDGNLAEATCNVCAANFMTIERGSLSCDSCYAMEQLEELKKQSRNIILKITKLIKDKNICCYCTKVIGTNIMGNGNAVCDSCAKIMAAGYEGRGGW